MARKIGVISLAVLLLTFLVGSSSVIAASASISRSYTSSRPIPTGSLVSLAPTDASSIVAANSSNGQKLAGVVENSNQSLLAVNPSESKVQVATDGIVNVLASTVNGNISVGQDVAVSPFNGVGMKSSIGDRIIGTADTAFSGSTSGVAKEQATNSSGKSVQLTVGYVKVTIAIGTMSSANSVQSFQQFIEAVTGRQVSVLRIVVSMVVAFIALLTIVTLIYASIYGSIISVGRNPLAKLAVFRTLSSVIAMVVFLAVVAAVTVYLLLY